MIIGPRELHFAAGKVSLDRFGRQLDFVSADHTFMLDGHSVKAHGE